MSAQARENKGLAACFVRRKSEKSVEVLEIKGFMGNLRNGPEDLCIEGDAHSLGKGREWMGSVQESRGCRRQITTHVSAGVNGCQEFSRVNRAPVENFGKLGPSTFLHYKALPVRG